MSLDVVVINYRTPDLLTDFVQSYEKHSWLDCTLSIVDITPERIVDYPAHTYVAVHDNLGYGRACNLGASWGANDVILLANADTLLTEGLLECYMELMAHPKWGVLGPRQVNDMNRITAGGIVGLDQSPSQRGWNEQDYGQYSDIVDSVLSVSGSLYFVKRSVWNEMAACPLFQEVQPGSLGGFLETPHYFDETFCSYHVRAHGYRCVYYGPVQMVHLWHRASAHGGWADQQFNISQGMHREACAHHGIICE